VPEVGKCGYEGCLVILKVNFMVKLTMRKVCLSLSDEKNMKKSWYASGTTLVRVLPLSRRGSGVSGCGSRLVGRWLASSISR